MTNHTSTQDDECGTYYEKAGVCTTLNRGCKTQWGKNMEGKFVGVQTYSKLEDSKHLKEVNTLDYAVRSRKVGTSKMW